MKLNFPAGLKDYQPMTATHPSILSLAIEQLLHISKKPPLGATVRRVLAVWLSHA
jgi:hypothetical protein